MNSTAPGSPRLPRFDHPTRLVAAVCMGVTLGQLGPITQPFQVGGLIDGAHKTSVEAGSLMAVQMVCYALALLGISRVTDRIGPVVICLGGLVVSIVAYAVMYMASDSTLLYFATALAGAGQGLVFAGALAAGARTPSPEKTFGLSGATAIIVASVFMAGIPFARQLLGARGVFAALCVTLLVLAPTIWDLGGKGQSGHATGSRQVERSGTAALLTMLILFGIGAGCIYTFTERVGTHLGLSQQRIGFIFMFCTVAAAGGSFAAGWVGLRWGRGLPLYVLLTATGCACLAIGGAWNSWVYAAGLMAFQVAYTSAAPFQFGAAAGLDPDGRLTAFAGGVHFMSWAIGAQIGGLLAQYVSLNAIGVFSMVMCMLATLAVPILVRAFGRLNEAAA